MLLQSLGFSTSTTYEKRLGQGLVLVVDASPWNDSLSFDRRLGQLVRINALASRYGKIVSRNVYNHQIDFLRCAIDHGFSLLEIMIALIILALIAVTLSRSTSGGIRVWERLEITATQADTREFYNLIRAVLQKVPSGTSELEQFSGSSDRMQFRSDFISLGTSTVDPVGAEWSIIISDDELGLFGLDREVLIPVGEDARNPLFQ